MNRIIGYDLARALAVFGMVVVNFKVVMAAEQNGPGWLVNLLGLLDGRAAATFVVLAGIGISLSLHKGYTQSSIVAAEVARVRLALLKRGLFLFVVGLLYAAFYSADILHFYGIYLTLAAFLLTASTRRLWAYSATLVLAFVGLLFLVDYAQGWDWQTLEYAGFWTLTGMLRRLFYNGFHPVIPWLAFLLVGMVVGRQDMGNRLIRRRIFLAAAGVALAAEGLSWLLIRLLASGGSAAEAVAMLGTEPLPPTPLYMLAGGGTAVAVIAAAVELGVRYRDAAWLRPLVATGQLSLSLYIAHVVIGMSTLAMLGRLENQTLAFALFAATLFCSTGCVFAYLWRAHYARGPLEAMLQRVVGK